jgi:GNAT superfamily N-acetyltransferase
MQGEDRLEKYARIPLPNTLREAMPHDREFLQAMLAEAFDWRGTGSISADMVRRSPAIWHYIEGWKQPSDFGVVWFDGRRGLGAAWARFLPQEDPGYGFVDAAVPEVTMAVTSEARGRGGGKLLLDGLIAAARDRGLDRLSLSVEDGNRAARSLYKSTGFVVVGREGDSDTMQLTIAPPLS